MTTHAASPDSLPVWTMNARVFSNGAPRSGVRVLAMQPGTIGTTVWSRDDRSDAEGRVSFEVPWADGGAAELIAIDGKQISQRAFVLPGDGEAILELHRAARLEVHAVGSDGRSLPDVDVDLVPGGYKATTDRTGRAILEGIPRGSYLLSAWPPRESSRSSVELQPVRLEAGARVQHLLTLPQRFDVTFEFRRPDGRTLEVRSWVRIQSALRTRTAVADEQGRVHVRDLEEGEYEVEMMEFDAPPRSVRISARNTRLRIDALGELRPERHFSGQVVSAEGTPVAGAKVVPSAHMGTPMSLERATTDSNGRFQYTSRLKAEPVSAVAKEHGWSRRTTLQPEVPARIQLTELSPAASAPGVEAIRVHVHRDGKPVPGAKVRIRETMSVHTLAQTTDASGIAVIALPIEPPTTWIEQRHAEFSVEDELGASERLVLSAGLRAATIHLRPLAHLEVRVLTPDGTPVPGATVMVRDVPERRTSDSEGKVLFSRLAPGRRRVKVEADGYDASHFGTEVTLMPGETASVDFRVEPIRQVRVIVRNQDRRVPHGVHYVVALRNEDEFVMQQVEGGEATLPLKGDGEWQVYVRDSNVPPVTVVLPGTTEISLTVSQ